MDRPTPFAHTRTVSATFPLTHKSPSTTPRPNDVSTPFADKTIPRHVQHKHTTSLGGSSFRLSQPKGLQESSSFTTSTPSSTAPTQNHGSPEPRHRLSRRDPFLSLTHHHHQHHPPENKPRHKHSKSRDLRLRPMSLASASARGLLQSRRDKDRDDFLRPTETRSSRWSERRGSLLDVPEQNEHLGPIRSQIQCMEDLERVKRRRKVGESYLRSALASTGTQATDVTRRLDYTYYNLLERITGLNATIASFQELSESAASFLNDFERETASLDTGVRKQIIELKGFEPQSEKAAALEERMRVGREKFEDLGKRLKDVRCEIESWERRELEWQERISRRLRIFWAVVGSAVLVVLLGIFLRNWPGGEGGGFWIGIGIGVGGGGGGAVQSI
ncbi:hypothetical protein N7533_011538 [Penicillium manginii]|uniref:uncharacterized protein n=1 Tax=Penicillium manginii TaxID=203109 RepID=UPI0025473F3C|nr:uncharacterized protein N7533_011538 [Penicillium manginii]KAJ5742129.1 hypothetical protein N7533_011538 [Penicillium manginii]